MFIYFQLFISVTFIGQIIVETADENSQTTMDDKRNICLICQLKEYDEDDDGDKHRNALKLQHDQPMAIDNLDKIENEILLINSTLSLQNRTDPSDWKNEFQKLYETFDFDKANKQLEILKAKKNEFMTERDVNKRNVLEKWSRLPILRLQIHQIEQNILNGDNFGDNLKIFQRIDSTRNLINEVSKILHEIYIYYKKMDSELLETYNILTDIQQKFDAKREKNDRSKCFFIFC